MHARSHVAVMLAQATHTYTCFATLAEGQRREGSHAGFTLAVTSRAKTGAQLYNNDMNHRWYKPDLSVWFPANHQMAG